MLMMSVVIWTSVSIWFRNLIYLLRSVAKNAKQQPNNDLQDTWFFSIDNSRVLIFTTTFGVINISFYFNVGILAYLFLVLASLAAYIVKQYISVPQRSIFVCSCCFNEKTNSITTIHGLRLLIWFGHANTCACNLIISNFKT